jgi:hypothetical protein
MWSVVADERDVRMHEEVAEWLMDLRAPDYGRAARVIDRFVALGERLRMPLGRPLGEGLFELRAVVAEEARKPLAARPSTTSNPPRRGRDD